MLGILILFIIIVLISLALAYFSMRDFEEGPEDFGPENGLFLIRKPNPLDPWLLDYLYKIMRQEGVIVSLERLFKGSESALVLYGPKKAILSLSEFLDLLELEDYVEASDPLIWQTGAKKISKGQKITESLFSDFPKLEIGEYVWFQLTLQAEDRRKHFKGQIRTIVVVADPKRKKLLGELLQTPKNFFKKMPVPYSSTQMMEFYKKRSIIGRSRIELSDLDIIKAWSLPNPQTSSSSVSPSSSWS